jgi:hypothetical protein
VDQSVDVRLPVTEITSLNEVLELPGAEATCGVGELEGPQEVGGLLKVRPHGEDLVDEVLDADDAVCAEVFLNDSVVGERDALLVDLSVTALVDKFTDGLQVGVSVGDEGLDDLEHLSGSLGETDEDTVVDLEETEQLEGLALLGVDLVDTGEVLAWHSIETQIWPTDPLIRMAKTSLDSAGTKNELSLRAARLASMTSRSALAYSAVYFCARSKITVRFCLLA